MEIQKYIDIVDSLNRKITYNPMNEYVENICFKLVYMEYMVGIDYGELPMWDGENDERRFIDEINDWEDLEDFIWKKFCKFVEDLYKVTNYDKRCC